MRSRLIIKPTVKRSGDAVGYSFAGNLENKTNQNRQACQARRSAYGITKGLIFPWNITLERNDAGSRPKIGGRRSFGDAERVQLARL